MRFAIDFDGTIVSERHAYDDLETPLRLLPGAREGLAALRRARHVMLLWSSRASRALLFDPRLDPLVRAGVVRENRIAWESARSLHEARYRQMTDFIDQQLPGVFDAIDDGLGGKPIVDFFIDNHAIRYGLGGNSAGWPMIARMWGDPAPRRSRVTP